MHSKTVVSAAVFCYAYFMNATTKNRLKTISIFIAGMIVGAFVLYGAMWYQVYQHFNDVWTCQVFTGQLSVHEAKHCEKWLVDNERKN